MRLCRMFVTVLYLSLFLFSFLFRLSSVSAEVRVNHSPMFMAYYHNWSVQVSLVSFIHLLLFPIDWLLACDILSLPLITDNPCNKKPHTFFFFFGNHLYKDI